MGIEAFAKVAEGIYDGLTDEQRRYVVSNGMLTIATYTSALSYQTRQKCGPDRWDDEGLRNVALEVHGRMDAYSGACHKYFADLDLAPEVKEAGERKTKGKRKKKEIPPDPRAAFVTTCVTHYHVKKALDQLGDYVNAHCKDGHIIDPTVGISSEEKITILKSSSPPTAEMKGILDTIISVAIKAVQAMTAHVPSFGNFNPFAYMLTIASSVLADMKALRDTFVDEVKSGIKAFIADTVNAAYAFVGLVRVVFNPSTMMSAFIQIFDLLAAGVVAGIARYFLVGTSVPPSLMPFVNIILTLLVKAFGGARALKHLTSLAMVMYNMIAIIARAYAYVTDSIIEMGRYVHDVKKYFMLGVREYMYRGLFTLTMISYMNTDNISRVVPIVATIVLAYKSSQHDGVAFTVNRLAIGLFTGAVIGAALAALYTGLDDLGLRT